jgi:hypothetical protein
MATNNMILSCSPRFNTSVHVTIDYVVTYICYDMCSSNTKDQYIFGYCNEDILLQIIYLKYDYQNLLIVFPNRPTNVYHMRYKSS